MIFIHFENVALSVTLFTIGMEMESSVARFKIWTRQIILDDEMTPQIHGDVTN